MEQSFFDYSGKQPTGFMSETSHSGVIAAKEHLPADTSQVQ